MILTFYPPNLPPTLNGDKGLLRMHWSSRKTIKHDFQWKIKEQDKTKFPGVVEVILVNYAIRLMDWDNLASRFKIIGDALESNGQIKDDSPNLIFLFYFMLNHIKR